MSEAGWTILIVLGASCIYMMYASWRNLKEIRSIHRKMLEPTITYNLDPGPSSHPNCRCSLLDSPSQQASKPKDGIVNKLVLAGVMHDQLPNGTYEVREDLIDRIKDSIIIDDWFSVLHVPAEYKYILTPKTDGGPKKGSI